MVKPTASGLLFSAVLLGQSDSHLIYILNTCFDAIRQNGAGNTRIVMNEKDQDPTAGDR